MNRLLAILILLAIIISSCESDKHTKDHHESGTSKLAVTQPIVRDTMVVKNYVSQIHASRHIEVRALERGYLRDIFVDEGQYLKKGQAMFKIMPNIYEAELHKTQAEAKAVEIEYQNTKMLADKQVVSANELALAEAQLDKAKAEVELAATHLSFTDIRAPFAGIMDHLHAREGSLLEEGELLTTLSDNSKMWVYFNVPESEYLDYATQKSKTGDKVRLEMANGKLFDQEGTVETIEGEFNRETGNIEFRATFPNPNGLLRHGETGNIKMYTPYDNALIIPQKATFEVLDKKYVYVVNEDNKLEQRKITIAAELPHLYLIAEGLKKEDRILLEGLRKVRNGQEIEAELVDPVKVLADLRLYAE
jgi:membrane fusion protein (multidrug efflux system)